LYPHTLLFKSKPYESMMNICSTEKKLHRKGAQAIDLLTGDLVRAVSFGDERDSLAEF